MSVRRAKRGESARMGAKMMTRAMGVLVAVGLLCGTVTASATEVTDTPVLDTNISQGAAGEGNGAVEGGAASGDNSNGDAGDGATGDGVTGDSSGDNTSADAVDGGSNAGASDSAQSGESDALGADNAGSDDAKKDLAAAKAANDSDFDRFLVNSDQPKNGTQVNLFDYWLEGRTDSNYAYDKSNNIGSQEKPLYPWVTSAKNPYGKINNGHVLYFSPGDTLDNTNRDNGNIDSNGYEIKAQTNQDAGLVQGLVEDELSNGYPYLKSNSDAGITKTESLDYLFNAEQSDATGKKAFMDTDGLLQVDDDGYYYYDSTKNFASFDEDTNSFKLYKQPAVTNGEENKVTGNLTYKNKGQFFPFNKASEVFKIDDDGELAMKDVVSTCPGSGKCAKYLGEGNQVNLNHYFGVSMTTRFMQPAGGKVTTPSGAVKPMTYEFSGDDDVWVFIDDTLVGDLGGIHNKASLKIDFSTGAVIVKDANGNQVGNTQYIGRILGGRGSTLQDNTFHTLKFFYLERGNVDSNMWLKFNLKTVPKSDVIKVDQNGDPVEGAEFELWAADEGYKTTGTAAIASGSTDVNGNLVLADADGNLINFDEQYKNELTRYYVLKETKAPAGYRKMPADMHLEYVPSDSDKAGGVIQSETATSDLGSIWYTGSMALSKVVASTPEEVKPWNGGAAYTAEQLKNGTLFAVVLRRDKSMTVTAPNAWHAVYGNQIDGWQEVEDTGLKGIAEAIIKNQEGAGSNVNVFAPNTNGSYEVTVENLPGDIQKYYWMLPKIQKDNAEYTVAYYYSDASSVDGINDQNITRLNSDDFIRQFGASLYVSNIKNQLFVQKVDDAGTPINGVEFKLYEKTACSDGVCSGEAYDLLTTEDLRTRKDKGENLPGFNGAGVFPNMKSVLPEGEYYLVEGEAPSGYIRNENMVEIIVNSYGVFANAGSAGDGIKVARGAGYLLKTVSSLGVSPNIDNTLTWIKSNPTTIKNDSEIEDTSNTTLSARVEDGKLVPAAENDKEKPLRLDHSATAKPLEYGPRETNGDVLYLADEGIPSLYTTQDETKTGPEYEHANRTNLGNLRLNALISGTVMVQVTNNRAGAHAIIELNKKVDGADWDSQKGTVNFGFTLTRTDEPVAGNAKDKVTYGTADENGVVTQHEVGSVTSFTTKDIKNGNQETVKFPELTFHDEGEYTFTLKENNTDNPADGWTYDKKTFTVTVNVEQADNGTMTATVSYSDLTDGEKLPLFVNMKYGPELPETGGTGTMSLIWGGLLLVGCSLAGLAYARRRW